MSPLTMILFIALAVFVNVLMYGGITWIYFRDKHRVDPPKTTVHPLPQRDHSEEEATSTPERLAS